MPQGLNEEAMRELMYEEANNYRRCLRGKQADLDDARFMRENVAEGTLEHNRQEAERESRREEAQLRNELMDANVLREVVESPLKKTKYNRDQRIKCVFNQMCEDGFSVRYKGQEYREFIKTLETEVGKDPTKSTCLTCW